MFVKQVPPFTNDMSPLDVVEKYHQLVKTPKGENCYPIPKWPGSEEVK